MNSKHSLVLALLITLLIANSLYFSKSFKEPARKSVIVSRVIDGDTLEAENTTFRLLNINTPEKNEKGYKEAQGFLSKFENEIVEIEEIGLDKYSRTLVRVYSPEYINLDLVKKGFAKKFLVQDSELNEFADAEEQAIENEEGLWKKSIYFSCISSEIDEQDERIALINSCDKISLKGWTITDESRKKYKFGEITIGRVVIHSKNGEDNKSDIFWNSNQSIWNNDRDTLYLFDQEGNVAHHSSYGY